MRAGKLRERITLLTFSTIRDEMGQPVETWTEGPTLWADVRAISGRELLAAGAETASTSIRIWLRYRRDVTAASRFICRTGAYAGQVLDVTNPPIPDAKRTRLEVLCAVGVKNA